MVLCIYHGVDLDGKGSAALIRLALAEDGTEVEMMPMNYGWEMDWERLNGHDTVYMVDFTLENFNQMLYLKSKVKHFVWIDHHVTAIESWEDAGKPDIFGIRRVGKAGIELTWEYLHKNDDVEMPYWVFLLGRYDVWDHCNDEVLPFQMGMRLFEADPDAGIWDMLDNPHRGMINRIVDTGKTILQYEDAQDKIRARSARYLEFQGHKAVALNLLGANSQRFNHCDKDQFDIMVAYHFTKMGYWKVSMYSETVDVGAIAKGMFGGGRGGGHKGAAGFQASTEEMIDIGLLTRDQTCAESD